MADAREPMTIRTDRGVVIKITEDPRWNAFHKRWYAPGYRFIKTRANFSGVLLLHNFAAWEAVPCERAA